MTDRRHDLGRGLAAGVLAAGCLLLGVFGMSPKPTTATIADLRANVQKSVTDPARAARAMAALDSVSALVPFVGELQSRTSNELRTTLRNYRATRADFESVIARWEADRVQVRTRAFAAHERFKQALTDDEWKKLKSEERAILFSYAIVTAQGTESAPKGGR